jgi:4-hydroxythreonine-4-phosphate dehydrogenase
MKQLLVALTVGDWNGIGPEVVLRSIQRPETRRQCVPVLVGPAAVFESAARRLGFPYHFVPYPARPGRKEVALIEPPSRSPIRIRPGTLSAAAGAAAGAALETAGTLALTGLVHAIVTAPVSKQALHRAGYRFPGQTEMLQQVTGAPSVAMMLVSRSLRVGLATIHIPLRAVARSLTLSLLTTRLALVHEALRRDWRIRRPRIAVLGLNPHAGEGGDLGREEAEVITPAIRSLRRRGMRLEGPFPADAFFARMDVKAYDAVFAMYHDQGLIPLKMSARGIGVNVSVGLPVVRTSPDHGTGFDIAGQWRADPSSTVEAIRLAVMFARNRGITLRTRNS